jgi:hypothetical protein
MKKKIEKKQIGVISVDAGLCWVGDPCYILHREQGLPDELGKNWLDFCEKIKDMQYAKEFKHDRGFDGLGVCVSTGFGDGCYPVYAKISDEGEWGKRVKEITIKFF